MYNIYIGSNNVTKELEKIKALEIIARRFDSFSHYEISGYWEGATEKTLKVEIVTEDKDGIINMCERLKEELEQDTILLSFINSENTFI